VPDRLSVSDHERTPSLNANWIELELLPRTVGWNSTDPPQLWPGARNVPLTASSQHGFVVSSIQYPNGSSPVPVDDEIWEMNSVAFVLFVIQNEILGDCVPTATLPKLIDLGVASTVPSGFFPADAVGAMPRTSAITTGASTRRRIFEPIPSSPSGRAPCGASMGAC
jgi:hypothetical protein